MQRCHNRFSGIAPGALALLSATLLLPIQASANESHQVDYTFCDGELGKKIKNPKIGASFKLCFQVRNLEATDQKIDLSFADAFANDQGLATQDGIPVAICRGKSDPPTTIKMVWDENGSNRMQFTIKPGQVVQKNITATMASFGSKPAGYAASCIRAVTGPAVTGAQATMVIQLEHANVVMAIDESVLKPKPIAPPPPPPRPTYISKLVSTPPKVTVKVGGTVYLSWRVLNAGTATWNTDKSASINVVSVECDGFTRKDSEGGHGSGWPDPTAPSFIEKMVAPGQTATIEWKFLAKNQTTGVPGIFGYPANYKTKCRIKLDVALPTQFDTLQPEFDVVK
ncbi:MAG: hypothetical protein HQL66_02420 [Magnetococcales bacterium]|nr:hypothetical protein [Magnetococcales bacterium]